MRYCRTHRKVNFHPLFPRSALVVVNKKPASIRFAKEPSAGFIYLKSEYRIQTKAMGWNVLNREAVWGDGDMQVGR